MNPSEMEEATMPAVEGRWFTLCRWLIVFVLTVWIGVYVVLSWRWPVIHDTTVIHYVSFLIDKGWAPYRQIGDMNMPGAYLLEGWALHLFGASDLGWRFYDLTLSAIALAAMVSVGRRYDWLAGFVAGVAFVLVHASEGAVSAGLRDQEMAVLLLAGYAFCFESVRRGVPWLMLPFALACGLAASVKPTMVPVGPVVLLIAATEIRRQGGQPGRYVAWAAAGAGAATAIVVCFLLSHGALGAFLYQVTKVLPHYATIPGPSWGYLLGHTLPVPLMVFAGLVVAAAVVDRNWGDWECWALLAGVAAGMLSFYGQRKGFSQHRCTTYAFVLLWGSIQIARSLRGSGLGRVLAAAGLAFLLLVDLPRDLQWASWQLSQDNFQVYLERDLSSIGVDRLQGQVQCLDIVDGCLGALFQLKIVQSTGATGDLLLFLPGSSPVVDEARRKFFAEIQHAPPDFFVLSTQSFVGTPSFEKVDRWPAFAAFLREKYGLVEQREFDVNTPSSHPGADSNLRAYRILMRHGVVLPQDAFR